MYGVQKEKISIILHIIGINKINKNYQFWCQCNNAGTAGLYAEIMVHHTWIENIPYQLLILILKDAGIGQCQEKNLSPKVS